MFDMFDWLVFAFYGGLIVFFACKHFPDEPQEDADAWWQANK